MGLLSFLASLEAARKKGNHMVGENDAVEEAGERSLHDGPSVKVLLWIVRELNCPIKQGKVRWVLDRVSCDIAILQESKMKDVIRPTTIILWGVVL